VYLVSWLRCLGGAAREYCGDPSRDGHVGLCVCVCVCAAITSGLKTNSQVQNVPKYDTLKAATKVQIRLHAFIITTLCGSQETSFTIQPSYPRTPLNRRLHALHSWSQCADGKNSVPVRNRTLVRITVMTELGCFKWYNSRHTAHHLI